jgi:hypothetical protein
LATDQEASHKKFSADLAALAPLMLNHDSCLDNIKTYISTKLKVELIEESLSETYKISNETSPDAILNYVEDIKGAPAAMSGYSFLGEKKEVANSEDCP